MAPKKKGGKKAQNDDWENEVGETPDPIAQATEDAKANGAGDEPTANGADAADEVGGGGLLAALKKNKNKKAKKGKPVQDFVEGEDPEGAAPTPPAADLENKAPEEATFDDEDVFAGNAKKSKGGKKEPEKLGNDDEEDGGAVKSKKEKEREKKEREKQRKKEQVS